MLENRDAYVQKLKAKIDEWNADIDKLTVKARQLKAEKEIEYRDQIEALRSKREAMEAKIASLRNSGESSWEELRKNVETSWAALKEGYAAAKDRFERDTDDDAKK